SLLRHPRLAQAFVYALELGELDRIVALGPGAEALDGELRVEGKPGFHLLARLVDTAEMRETSGEQKERQGYVAVRVDRFLQPVQGLLVLAEKRLGSAHMKEPC